MRTHFWPSDVGQTHVWGQVISVSPLTVRVAGETTDLPVSKKFAGVTPALEDLVALERFGAQWVVTGVIVDT